MRTTGTVLATGLLILSFGVGLAGADHGQITDQCTYEVGAVGDMSTYTYDPDPTGLTEDGTLNWGGCVWWFPDADPGGESVLDPIVQPRPVDGEHAVLQVAIVDDVFASQLGGRICSDADHDFMCGEDDEGEINDRFCGGSSPVFVSDDDADGDGHPDFGFSVGVFVNGPLNQNLYCGATTTNPVGATTGGVLDPAGGIYLHLGG